jgi:hypothetical protein
VLRFLSDAWLQALDDRTSEVHLVEPLDLCVEHVVGDTVYHVAFAGRQVRFVPGAAHEPAVRLRTSRPHAVAIARGETSAQRLFMNGELSLEGDAHALVRALPALRQLDDVFAEVRAETEWDAPSHD